MSDTVRMITITEDKSGIFFATSEDEPGLFCAATSLSAIFESIQRVLYPVPNSPVDVSAIDRRAQQIDSELPELMYSWTGKRP